MGWFAVSPLRREGAPPPGNAALRDALARVSHVPDLLERGTLLIELSCTIPNRPVRLFDLEYSHPRPGRLTLSLVPGDAVMAVQQQGQGQEAQHMLVNYARSTQPQVLRVTLTWDCSIGFARLWAETPDQDAAPQWADLKDPAALSRDGLALAVASPEVGFWADELDFVAVSDRVEPIGPQPGLSGMSPIETPDGVRRVDEILPGDEVIAVNGAGRRVAVPVLSVIEHVLPARGSFRPVQLRAPYFGLRADLRAAANQRMVLGGSDVEYMFASEKVLVPVQYLISDRTGRYLDGAELIAWYHLLLPEQEALQVSGVALESMHVGRMRRSVDTHMSSHLVRLLRRDLPHHAMSAHPILRGYEATMLASQRSL
jgi:hypothetical protein